MNEVAETHLVVNNREVVLLSGNGKGSPARLCEVGETIRQATGSLVLVDFDGTARLELLSAARMRDYGWVRVEELEQLRRELTVGAPS